VLEGHIRVGNEIHDLGQYVQSGILGRDFSEFADSDFALFARDLSSDPHVFPENAVPRSVLTFA